MFLEIKEGGMIFEHLYKQAIWRKYHDMRSDFENPEVSQKIVGCNVNAKTYNDNAINI